MSEALAGRIAIKRRQTSLGLIALEPRQMYDGAAVATASAAIKSAAATHTAATVVQGNAAQDGGRHEVVFVDGGMSDVSNIVAAVAAARPGATVAVLDPNGNELQEMADYLQGASNIDAIHIVSHGSAGDVFLGSQVLSDATIAENQPALAAIGQAVKSDGEILIYGCDVAAGGVGQQLITDLADATGRVIAASTDDTGAASLGGNWTLESATGKTTVASIDATSYDGLLAGLPSIDAVFNSASTIGSGTNWNTAGTTEFITAGTSNGTQSDTGAATTSAVTAAELTGNFASQAGSLVYNTPFSANAGLDITYTYYAGPSTHRYPGSGGFDGYAADGIGFFLINGATDVNSGSFHVGQPGAALGYAGASAGTGVTGAILGVGVDEFGNFSVNSGIAGSGGASATPDADLITVRGNAASDYQYLQSSGQLSTAQVEGTHTVEVILTTNDLLTVKLDGVTEISNLNVSSQIGSTSTLLFGFSASTGASWNEHAIESVTVTGVGAPSQPSTPPSSPVGDGTSLPTVNGVPTVTETAQDPVTFSGSSDASVTDTLLDNGTLSTEASATTTSDSSGHYDASITLSEGSHNITVQSFKTVNGISVPSLQSAATTVDVAIPPTIDSVTNVTTASETIKGSVPDAVDGSTTVSLYDGSTLVASNIAVSTVNGEHVWSYDGSLSVGSHTLTAVETTDGVTSGNSNAVTVDVPPAVSAPTLKPSSDSGTVGDNLTNVTTPVLVGTVTVGSTVTVYENSVEIGTATVDGSGNYSFTVPTSLADGSYDFDVVAAKSGAQATSTTTTITIDATAPSAPSVGITTATDTGTVGDGITSDTTPVLTGMAEAGSTVTIKDGSTVLGTATADMNGDWSFSTSTLSEGTHEITATATDAAGNVSSPSSDFALTIDTTAPARPVVTGITAATDGGTLGDGLTNVTTPVLVGTAEADSTVTIKDGSTILGTTTTNASGDWSFTTPSLGDSTHSITATATDTAGNTGPAAAPFSLTIDTHTPAAPTINGITTATDTGTVGDGITSDATPVVTGTGAAGSTVTLYDGTTVIGTATVDGTGHWSVTTPTLTDGTHALTSTVTDPAGTTGPASAPFSLTIDTHTPAASTINGITAATDTGTVGDGITSDTVPVVTGTGEPGSTVTLYNGTTVIGTGTVDSSGHYSITTPTLSDGTYSLTTTVTDSAGTTGPASAPFSLTIDTHTPTAPTITGLTAGTDTGVPGTTSDTTPTVTGTGEPGSTVTLYNGTTVIGTGTVDSSGHYSITTQSLADGTYSLTTTVTDSAGTTGPASAPFSLTIDTHTPTAPTITGLTAGTDTGIPGTTSDTTPTVTGTGEPGSTVTLYDGTTVIGTATVDSSGHYSITTPSLSDGTYSLTTTVTDSAGTPGPASAPFSLTIDTHTPTAPTITGLTAGTGTGIPGTTSDTAPTVTGTGEPGSTVTLYDGTTVIGTATVDSSGHYSITTPTLSDGTHTLTTTVTDTAGTTGPASAPFSLTIDTHTPTAPTITGLTSGTDTGIPGTTSDTTPTVTGTGEPGSTVTLYDGTTAIGTATVDSSGHYSITTPTLSDGTHTLTTTVTDSAGTTGLASAPFSLTIDTHTPAAPLVGGITAATDTGTVGDGITSDRSPTLVGTAEAGSTVTVYDGATVLGTAVADAGGHWSFTPTTPLADGAHALSFTATDAANTTGPRSGTFTLTIGPSTTAAIPEQSFIGGSTVSFTVPANAFALPAGDTATYTAQLVNADGSPAGALPSWLTLNAATGTFSGAAPIAASGTLHIQLTISDGHGDTSVSTFDLTYQGPPTPIPVATTAPVVPTAVASTPAVQTAAPTLATVVHDDTPVLLAAATQATGTVVGSGGSEPLLLTSQAAGGFQVGVAATGGSGSGSDALITVKPVADVAVQDNTQINYSIGVDTFNATNPQAVVHLTATLADGQPLPGWLSFDPRTGAISGQAPASQQGVLDVLVTARDTEGHEAQAHIKIEVGTTGPQTRGAKTDRHADAGGRHTLRVADTADLADAHPVFLRDIFSDQGRSAAKLSLSSQIRSAHPGSRLVQQAALFRAADQMLRRS